MRKVTRSIGKIVLVLFLFFYMIPTNLTDPSMPSTIDSEIQRVYARSENSDPPIGYTNRSLSGTNEYLGDGVYRYTSRLGERNTWNGTDYVPYIWNSTDRTVSHAGHVLEFYDWYTVLKNSTATVVDDIRWVCQYWFEAESQWNTLDLYDYYYLNPVLNDDEMSYGYRMTDGSSTMNVTYTFRNNDEVKTQIDFYAATTNRYRFTWQLTGMSQSPMFLNDTVDSDGDGNNDTLGAVFDNEIKFMWNDVEQTNLDCWYNWTEPSKKLDVYIGNTTINAGNVLTIDPNYNIASDSEDAYAEIYGSFSLITSEDYVEVDFEFELTYIESYLRFQLPIPFEEVIVNATLFLNETADPVVKTIWTCRQDISNATVAPEDLTGYPAGGKHSTEQSFVTDGSAENDYVGWNVTDVVQSQVDHSGWQSDNFMLLIAYQKIGTSNPWNGEDFQAAGNAEAYIEIDWADIDDSEYNYVDNNNSNKDGSSDLGTHSSFSDQQSAPDSTYDTLTETDQGDGFWNWAEDHYDQEDSDQDSSADVGTQTNPTYANDSINSQYMNLQEANQGGGGGTTEYKADSWTDSANEWTNDANAYDGDWGTAAYDLGVAGGDDYPSNYAYGFDSANSGSGTITQVDIVVRLSASGFTGSSDWWQLTLDVGSSTGNALSGSPMYDQALTNLTYTDVTEPNGGGWSWSEIWSAQVHFDTERVGGADGADVYIYEYAFKVTTTIPDDYELNFEYEWESAVFGTGSTGNVCIYVQTADQTGGENLKAWEWDGSDWAVLGTVSDNGWNNFTSSYLTSSSYYIMLNDSLQSDEANQDSWNIDLITLATWNSTNYRLDLEIQWTTANYTRTNEYICIYTGSLGSEDIEVYIWNETSSAWDSLWTDLSASGWNNISVSAEEGWAEQQTITLRFLDDNQTNDGTTQDTWQIDSSVYRSYTLAGQSVTVYELIEASDTTTTNVDFSTTINELIDVFDTIVASASVHLQFLEQILFSETTAITVGLLFSILEILGLAVSVPVSAGMGITSLETIGLFETVMAYGSFSTTISEIIGLIDLSTVSAGLSNTIFELLGLADTVSTSQGAQYLVYETIGLVSITAVSSDVKFSINEIIDLSSSTGAYADISLTMFELIDFFDSVTTIVVGENEFYVTIFEVIGASESTTVSMSASVTVLEIVGLAESTIASMGASVMVLEIIGLAESTTVSMSMSVTVLEIIGLAETTTAYGGQYLTVFEIIGLYDSTATSQLTHYYVFEVIGIISSVGTAGGVLYDPSGSIFYQIFFSENMWSYLGPFAMVTGGYFVTKKEKSLGVVWFIVICLIIAQYLTLVPATMDYWWHIFILLFGGMLTCVFPLWSDRR